MKNFKDLVNSLDEVKKFKLPRGEQEVDSYMEKGPKGKKVPIVIAKKSNKFKVYVDVINSTDHVNEIKKVDNSNFLKAIWTILLADFTMSLDNVLGVAGAAGDHYKLLVFGLVLSIVLMAFAATLISNWIKKYKWIAWAGLLAILIVAIELIYTDIQILFL